MEPGRDEGEAMKGWAGALHASTLSALRAETDRIEAELVELREQRAEIARKINEGEDALSVPRMKLRALGETP